MHKKKRNRKKNLKLLKQICRRYKTESMKIIMQKTVKQRDENI